MPTPRALRRDEQSRIVIEWDDDSVRTYTPRELRDACPCATCCEKRRAPKPDLPILAAGEIGLLQVTGMEPMGGYAYAIEFSDGHNSGIYTLEQLMELGTTDG
jgi:DUF971 family protein